MDSYLNMFTQKELVNLVQELNIRNKVPRYTKVTKEELIAKLKDVLELVEKDGDMHFAVKK